MLLGIVLDRNVVRNPFALCSTVLVPTMDDGKNNSGRVSGFVVGAFGEVSMRVRDLADLVACELTPST